MNGSGSAHPHSGQWDSFTGTQVRVVCAKTLGRRSKGGLTELSSQNCRGTQRDKVQCGGVTGHLHMISMLLSSPPISDVTAVRVDSNHMRTYL